MATETHKVTPEVIAKRLGLPSSTIQQLEKGQVVTKESDASTAKDLSLIVATLLNGSVSKVWEFAQAERMHEIQDAMLSVGDIDDPANNPEKSLEAMELTEDTVQSLMKNPFLNKAEAHRVKEALKHGKGAHEYKKVLAERVKDYWNKGLEGIVAYEGKGRDPKEDLTAANQESLKIIQNPTMRREMQTIPAKSTHPEMHSIQWGIQQGNDQAAPILTHKIRLKAADNAGMVSVTNQFYSGSDKDSSQIVAGAVPLQSDQDRTALFYVNRTYTAAVTGFGGGAKRSVGRKIMKGKLMDTMKKAQALKF